MISLIYQSHVTFDHHTLYRVMWPITGRQSRQSSLPVTMTNDSLPVECCRRGDDDKQKPAWVCGPVETLNLKFLNIDIDSTRLAMIGQIQRTKDTHLNGSLITATLFQKDAPCVITVSCVISVCVWCDIISSLIHVNLFHWLHENTVKLHHETQLLSHC